MFYIREVTVWAFQITVQNHLGYIITVLLTFWKMSKKY